MWFYKKSIKMADIKFKDIKTGVIRKQIVAKLVSIQELVSKAGKPYLAIILAQGKSRIKALAFENHIDAVRKFYKGQVGNQLSFPSNTFMAEKRDKKYPSDSKSSVDLKFISVTGIKIIKTAIDSAVPSTSKSHTLKTETKSQCQFATVKAKIRGRNTFSCSLDGISIEKGTIYRYMGCKNCTSRILTPKTDGKYYCKRNCAKVEKKRGGVETELKMYTMIRNLSVKDACGCDDGVIDNLVVFDKQCAELNVHKYAKLIGKEDEDFLFDEDMNSILRKMRGNKYNFTISRGRKIPNSKFPPSVIVHSIILKEEMQFTTSTSNSQNGDNIQADNIPADDNEDVMFTGKKKKNKKIKNKEEKPKLKLPTLTPFEVKIETKPYLQLEVERSALAITYAVKSKPPGMVLLINNKLFNRRSGDSEEVEDRKGSEIDVKLLKDLFKVLGYTLFGNKCFENIATRKELSKLFTQFKNALEENGCDIAFVIILSHGANGEILLTGSDTNTNTANIMQDIITPFSNTNFSAFETKPKIFISQACQGFATSSYSRGLNAFKNGFSDILVCQSSLPGFSSYRSEQNGSIYIYHLVKTICKHALKVDLRGILDLAETKIFEAIKEEGTSDEVSTPYHYGIIFQKLYLLPWEEIAEDDEEEMDQDD